MGTISRTAVLSFPPRGGRPGTRSDVRDKLMSMGAEAAGSKSEQLAAAVKSAMAVVGKVIKDAGILVDPSRACTRMPAISTGSSTRHWEYAYSRSRYCAYCGEASTLTQVRRRFRACNTMIHLRSSASIGGQLLFLGSSLFR